MRIGIYNPRVGIAESGGTETFLREMLKRISPNHEVVLYTGSGDLHEEVTTLDIEVKQFPVLLKETRKNQLVTGNTPILPAEMESLSMYVSVRRAGGFDAMVEEVDVVSTHYYLDNVLVSRKISVPMLFRYPGIKAPTIRWRFMARTGRPDVVVANSGSTYERSKNWLDIEPDGTVYAGVDPQQFSPNSEPAFDSDVPVVLFVGRLDEGKGLNDLLRAFANLENEAELHLVGEGTLEEYLRARARELDIDDSVIFQGPIHHGDIHSYYAAADIFCLPSYHEGFPVVNMEAMASGLSVVSTTIEAVKDQIEDGVQGLLVPPGDIPALSEALSRLLSDSNIRKRLGMAARERAKEQFTWDQQATRLINFYDKAANKAEYRR